MGSRRVKKAYIENNNLRIVFALHVMTTHDRNGNPRKAYVLMNGTPSEIAPLTMSGNIITVIEENYAGNREVHTFIDHTMRPWHETLVVWGPTIHVTPKEYRELVKHHKGLMQAAVPREQQRPKRDDGGRPDDGTGIFTDYSAPDVTETERSKRSELKTVRVRGVKPADK